MDESLARLEARLADVERAVRRLDGRLRAIESAPHAPAGVGPAAAAGPVIAPRPRGADADGTLTMLGQTLVIFAGAYLLRAFTESATVGRIGGVALGLAYAVTWALVADRVAARTPLRATFYGGTAVLLGLPLLWEATTRFHLLAPAASAVMLTLLTGVVLAVAWRQHLHVLAWVATAGGIVAGAALLVATGAAVAFAGFFTALGVATLWLGYDREWVVLRWPAALVADGAVFGLTARALTTPPRDPPATVLALELLLLVVYLASIGLRTLALGRTVLPFEVVQMAAVLLVGLSGAMVVVHRTGTAAATGLGWALMAMAAGSYALAFAFLDRRQERRANLYFYTSLALVFVLTGSHLLMSRHLAAMLWAGFAVAAAATARRQGRFVLAIHAVVFSTAAALSSGLLGASIAGLCAAPVLPWPSVGTDAWVALVASVWCVLLLAPVAAAGASYAPGMPRRAMIALAVVAIGGMCTIVLAAGAGRLAPAASTEATVATVRTVIVAAAVLVIAWLGRREETREFSYLLYPVLVWGAVKLVIEDFRVSPASLLVIALASYGGALILAARMMRARLPRAAIRGGSPPQQTPAIAAPPPSEQLTMPAIPVRSQSPGEPVRSRDST